MTEAFIVGGMACVSVLALAQYVLTISSRKGEYRYDQSAETEGE